MSTLTLHSGECSVHNTVPWTDEEPDILDPKSICWDHISRSVQTRIDTFMRSVPPLKEEDAFLLYLILLALYEEGVKPSFSEIHYKLKEHHCSIEVERHFLQYYLAQPEWYKVKIGSAEVPCNHSGAALLQGHSYASSKRVAVGGPTSPPLSDTIVLFVREPSWFGGWVNLRDNANHYPTSIWRDFVEFLHDCTSKVKLSSPAGSGVIFKTTRYSLAKTLKELGPPSVRQLRLGEIAHMVQLAVQQNILCYDANVIQPTWTSCTIVSMKDYEVNLSERESDSEELKIFLRALRTRTPDSPARSFLDPDVSSPIQSRCVPSILNRNAAGAFPEITELSTLKEALVSLLQTQSGNRILLSQLRVILQSKLHLSLQPLHFGYPKLSNLLLDRCSDVCRLMRHRSRHVYVELLTGSSIPEAGTKTGVEILLPNRGAPSVSDGKRMTLTQAIKTRTRIESVISLLEDQEASAFGIISRSMLAPETLLEGRRCNPVLKEWTFKDLLEVEASLDCLKACEVLDNEEMKLAR